MERWAANTLRTLGIILTAGFVLITSLILLLFSMCAANGDFGGNKHPDQVVPYLIAAGTVLALGIWFIVWLARGIHRSAAIADPTLASVPAGALPPSSPTPAHSAVPLHLSPLGRRSINRLVLALGAQLTFSALALIFDQLHFWSGPRPFSPFPSHNWLLVAASFVLYHIPYAVLIYVLLKRPDRRVFTYSLAVPAVFIMQSLLSLGYFSIFAKHPLAVILLVVPWVIHILILVLAHQATQQVGLHPMPSSLIVAALASFAFFFVVHVFTTLLFRFAWR